MATYKVGADGKAPAGLKPGDTVVTGGGTYTIGGVNANGSYTGAAKTSNANTYNYGGGYVAPPAPPVASANPSQSYTGNPLVTPSAQPKTVTAGKDGKAPSGLQAGDQVVTKGGTYTIGGVNSDGSYYGATKTSNANSYGYKGSYAPAPSAATAA